MITGIFVRALIALIVWLAIIVCHFWICKKRVWLKYDFKCKEEGSAPVPTRGDLMNEQYRYGGPLIIFPGLNIIVLIATWVSYIGRKCEYNEIYHSSDLFENQPLKR